MNSSETIRENPCSSVAKKSFAAEFASRLAAWSDIQGHLPFLYEEASKRKVILELGVRSGISTAALLAGVESQMEPARPRAGRGEGVPSPHLWSVDIQKPHVPSWWLQSPLWTFTLGNDLADTTLNSQPSTIDFLFIDTSHLYDQTLAELRSYAPRVQAGGIICCHDTELVSAPGLPVGCSSPMYESFPVARALETYCAETGLKWENRTGSYGLGVIRI